MTINSTAAAYGLFQVAFADVTYHLAQALLALKRHHHPAATLKWPETAPTTMLKNFRHELEQFRNAAAPDDDVEALQRTCREIECLARWRNVRIHARVEETADGLALCDWQTGQRLPITEAECEQNIAAAAKIIADLAGHMSPLLVQFKVNRSIDELLFGPEESEKST
jgi:hypothetical protein